MFYEESPYDTRSDQKLMPLRLLRRAVYGRLAGDEDLNDAARLARDPAVCAIARDSRN